MLTALSHYLESVRGCLKLDLTKEKEVIRELETHIEDRLGELKQAGLSEQEAAKNCLDMLGPAKTVAQQLYEAYSQGTWQQSLLAATPPLLFGVLFALNLWQHIAWQTALLALILGATAYGLWRGRPTWVFPWLGYTLLPVLVIGLVLIYLPKEWILLTLPLYLLLTLWWLHYIVVRALKRDWLFTSLMLLPVPIIIGWFLVIAPQGKLNESSLQRLHDFAPWISLSFLSLSLTIAAFFRLRQRQLRVILLIISGLATLTTVTYFANGRLVLPDFLLLLLAMWTLFLIPPLLERKVRDN